MARSKKPQNSKTNGNFTNQRLKGIRVELNQGIVIGKEDALPNGSRYYSFSGIPYAEPPVGHLRFQSPTPLETFFTSPLDCRSERGICFQKDVLTQKHIGGEDCLYLNVYVPEVSGNKSLPVMVWIHGGAFSMGSGNSDYYSPEYLLQQDVIVVTINYRLSIFGFLYLPEVGIFGNAGLKDQRLALKWVHENISRFGGNPGNVTLFGQSAGAVCAQIHSLSHDSARYFKRIILQSATALNYWTIEKYPKEKTLNLAKCLGCNETDPFKILEFLRSIEDLATLVKPYYNVLSADEKRLYPIPFKPCIELLDSPDAVLTKHPFELLRWSNDLPKVDILMGYNSNDGTLGLVDLYKYKKYEKYDNDLARFIPKIIGVDNTDANKCKQIVHDMREFYFNGKPISPDALNEACVLFTDHSFMLDLLLSTTLYSRYQPDNRVYLYRFNVTKELNLHQPLQWMGLPDNEKKCIKGACHGDELAYLFTSKALNIDPETYPDAFKTMNLMCKLWTNFAKYGDPTPPNWEFPFIWSPIMHFNQNIFDKFSLDYLAIENDSVRMKKDPDNERVLFWRRQYEKYNDSFKEFAKAKL